MTGRLVALGCLAAGSVLGQLQLFTVPDGLPAGTVVDMGVVSPGATLEQSFRLKNTGGASETLSVLSVAGTAFDFSTPPSLPMTLASGNIFDFKVRFQPATPGSYSAVLSINTTSVFLRAAAVARVTVSVMQDGAPTQLTSGTLVNFGTADTATPVVRRFTLENKTTQPMAAPPISLSLPVLGSDVLAFSLSLSWTGSLTLAPGDKATFDVTLLNTAPLGAHDAILQVDQRQYTLHGVIGKPLPPIPKIALDQAVAQSAQTDSVVVRLAPAAKFAGSGQVQLDFRPASTGAPDDPAIAFLTGGRTATFSYAAGDDIANFGGASSARFQTGTTAGTITLTVTLGDVTDQTSLAIPPQPVGFDPLKTTRTATGIELRVNGFDNTRSVSQLSFSFFDAKGQPIKPGALKVDATSDFRTYFAGSSVGGMFSLRAVFPVTGDATQIDNVVVELDNSAGPSLSQKAKF